MSNTIKMETTKYSEYVKRIKSESRALLGAGEQPAVPDEGCLKNAVIPDYVVANEETIDTIKRLQDVFLTVNKLMENIRINYEEKVDEAKSNELEQSQSDSASAGSEIDHGKD